MHIFNCFRVDHFNYQTTFSSIWLFSEMDLTIWLFEEFMACGVTSLECLFFPHIYFINEILERFSKCDLWKLILIYLSTSVLAFRMPCWWFWKLILFRFTNNIISSYLLWIWDDLGVWDTSYEFFYELWGSLMYLWFYCGFRIFL